MFLHKKRFREVILVGLVTLMAACASRVVYVREAPPRARVEKRVAKPGPNFVWVGGHWKWNGRTYVWASGQWVKKRKGQVWVPGHWRHTKRGYVWVKGHWR
ncbi:MAG: hypothetical protein ACE5HO_02055 [bacterium]